MSVPGTRVPDKGTHRETSVVAERVIVVHVFIILRSAIQPPVIATVVDRDFVYSCSSIFSYLWGLFYCAQDIDA